MEQLLPILAVGAFILIAIVISIAAAKAKEARQKAYAEFAARHGFQLEVPEPPGCMTGGFLRGGVIGDSHGVTTMLEGMHPFNAGDSRMITVMVNGPKAGSHWFIFDYQYSTGSGKNRTTHHLSVVVARTNLLFPYMTVRGQNFLDNIGGAIGFKDIQFELEDFNRRYHVKCADERRCFDLIHPQMIEYLMSIPERDMTFSANLFVVVHDRRPDVYELERTVLDMQGVLERVPAYVKQDIGFGNQGSGTVS